MQGPRRYRTRSFVHAQTICSRLERGGNVSVGLQNTIMKPAITCSWWRTRNCTSTGDGKAANFHLNPLVSFESKLPWCDFLLNSLGAWERELQTGQHGYYH